MKYFLKSHKGFWCDGSAGYTTHLLFAGLFDEHEALETEKASKGETVAIKQTEALEKWSHTEKLANVAFRNMKAIGITSK